MSEIASKEESLELDEVEIGVPHIAPAYQLTIFRKLMRLLNKAKPISPAPKDGVKCETQRPFFSAIEFDADDDCRYSRMDKLFSRVAHIFHQNWCGIRSAAGVQPGHKVAIPLDHPLKNADLLELVSHLKEWRVEKAAFHGFSHAAERVLRAVRAADIDCYLVWHGNLSQLVWEPEVQFFERALIACRQGFFRQAHMMKAGMGMVFPRTYEPMLLNCPPLTNRHRLVPAFAGKHKIALVSAFPDIRKNLHSSSLEHHYPNRSRKFCTMARSMALCL